VRETIFKHTILGKMDTMQHFIEPVDLDGLVSCLDIRAHSLSTRFPELRNVPPYRSLDGDSRN